MCLKTDRIWTTHSTWLSTGMWCTCRTWSWDVRILFSHRVQETQKCSSKHWKSLRTNLSQVLKCEFLMKLTSHYIPPLLRARNISCFFSDCSSPTHCQPKAISIKHRRTQNLEGRAAQSQWAWTNVGKNKTGNWRPWMEWLQNGDIG